MEHSLILTSVLPCYSYAHPIFLSHNPCYSRWFETLYYLYIPLIGNSNIYSIMEQTHTENVRINLFPVWSKSQILVYISYRNTTQWTDNTNNIHSTEINEFQWIQSTDTSITTLASYPQEHEMLDLLSFKATCVQEVSKSLSPVKKHQHSPNGWTTCYVNIPPVWFFSSSSLVRPKSLATDYNRDQQHTVDQNRGPCRTNT
jgi:hypothetical protein